MDEKQFLIEFNHNSPHLGCNGYGILLVTAPTFGEACRKITKFRAPKVGSNGQAWLESFSDARNFTNLTIF